MRILHAHCVALLALALLTCTGSDERRGGMDVPQTQDTGFPTSDSSGLDGSRSDSVGVDVPADSGGDDADTARDATSADTVAPPDVEALWGQTTVPFDPECRDCTPVLAVKLAHGAEDVELLYDAEVDDPLTRWGDCLDSVFDCVRADSDLDSCVAVSRCPDPCKDTYEQAAADATSRAERFARFDALFIDVGGACAIPQPPTTGGGQ